MDREIVQFSPEKRGDSTTVATRKRGPLKVDLTGIDGKRKIDARYCPISDQYSVRIGNRRYRWTATEFADHFRRWLIRQKES